MKFKLFKKWFKKVDLWHECAGHILGLNWVAKLAEIMPIFCLEKKDNPNPWRFRCITGFNEQGDIFAFPTEQEATAAREALVKWVKEVQ